MYIYISCVADVPVNGVRSGTDKHWFYPDFNIRYYAVIPVSSRGTIIGINHIANTLALPIQKTWKVSKKFDMDQYAWACSVYNQIP